MHTLFYEKKKKMLTHFEVNTFWKPYWQIFYEVEKINFLTPTKKYCFVRTQITIRFFFESFWLNIGIFDQFFFFVSGKGLMMCSCVGWLYFYFGNIHTNIWTLLPLLNILYSCKKWIYQISMQKNALNIFNGKFQILGLIFSFLDQNIRI